MDCRALKRVTNVGLPVAVFGWAIAASAQEAPEDRTPPPPASESGADEQPPAQSLPPCPPKQVAAAPTPAPAPEHRHNRVFAPQEVSVTTGAGPANYFGSALNGTVDVGAGWDARVTFGARSVIALEAGYVGGTNNVDVQGTTNHGRLSSNGLDGDLRLQVPTVVEPYVFGGVGYNHMSLSGTSNVSNAGTLSTSDDQVTVPAGGGVTGYIGKHATVDLRGTYRFIPDNGLTQMASGHLHQWVAQARVGYTF
jgi:hypothetical protein